MKYRICCLLAVVCCLLSASASVHETALQRYIDNGDTSFRWEVVDSTRAYDIRAYRLRLTSQTWRGIPWYHEMVVLIPKRVKHATALLHLTGGSEDEQTGQIGYHDWQDETIQTLGRMAHNCRAVTAVVWQVPRQPLFGGLYEDELVSYTFHQFQQTGDETWPLLLPMTKTAIRAMDVITELAASRRVRRRVDRFVVNGVSKRGWTTWLTAAAEDPRVVAIAPMVIDMLNMPVSLAYQKSVYGDYSREIKDYVNLGLTETASSPEGRALVDIVDPYSYRRQLSLPKMIFMGTNDEYWTADAVKNYIDSIPGTNTLVYIPNTGHGLGDRRAAVLSLEAFFHQTLRRGRYNTLRTAVSVNGTEAHLDLEIQGNDRVVGIQVWEARSQSRDFRRSHFQPAIEMQPTQERRLHIPVRLPDYEYKAFFVMISLQHPLEAEPYTICSRMFTADNGTVLAQPYKPFYTVDP